MDQKKYISLTFDDGPTLGITDQVLDILEQYNIVASFFLIGNQITPETEYLVKRAYHMGCTIENHTDNHLSMPALSDEEIRSEVAITTEKIIRVVGEKPEYFRPPYIDFNQKMFDLIDLHFICGVGFEDWVLTVSAKDRIDRMLAAAKSGSIYLLHDMPQNVNTVEALKVVVPELLKQGYTFVTVRDLFRLSDVTPQKGRMYSGIEEFQTADN